MDAAWFCSLVLAMRSTVTLVDELLARAEQLCGPLECSALLRQALQALVQRESAKRLAALGGSESGIDPVRCTQTNRAFSRCLITCSFPSAAAKPPASQPQHHQLPLRRIRQHIQHRLGRLIQIGAEQTCELLLLQLRSIQSLLLPQAPLQLLG